MKYEKSMTEVFQWKEESGNELYNLTIIERPEILMKSEKTGNMSRMTENLTSRCGRSAMLTVNLTSNPHNQS